jgi:hypothetical protein
MNWDLMNDGLGNPKNSKSLLLSHKTPPVMSLGVRAQAEMAVRTGFKYIQMIEPPEEDAQAVDAYLRSLRPVKSPYLQNGGLSESAKRGRAIFDRAGCIQCHSGPLKTDQKKYDLGLGDGMDKDKPFDTPTLVEVWRTAPYLYDGRAVSIMDVLKRCNPDDRHGRISQLSNQELEDLAQYVLSQ